MSIFDLPQVYTPWYGERVVRTRYGDSVVKPKSRKNNSVVLNQCSLDDDVEDSISMQSANKASFLN